MDQKQIVNFQLYSYEQDQEEFQSLAAPLDVIEYVNNIQQIISWNINAQLPNSNSREYFDDLFKFEEAPDIIVFCLQEMVKLDLKNMVMYGQDDIRTQWVNEILKNLNQNLNFYEFLESISLVGLCMSIFVKSQIRKNITSVETDYVKTGLGGNLGNKGGLAIRIKIKGHYITFLNCHLPAGQQNLSERNIAIKKIHQQAFQKDSIPKYLRKGIDHSSVKFLIGDLNFRVDMKYQEALDQLETIKLESNEKVKEKLLQKILDQDQLLIYLKSSDNIYNYQEGKINFIPTYKFDNGTDKYDTSKKKRVPSWCDRILVSIKDELITQQQLYYKSFNQFKISDHKPVSSYYQIDITKPIEDKNQRFQQQLSNYFFNEDFEDINDQIRERMQSELFLQSEFQSSSSQIDKESFLKNQTEKQIDDQYFQGESSAFIKQIMENGDRQPKMSIFSQKNLLLENNTINIKDKYQLDQSYNFSIQESGKNMKANGKKGGNKSQSVKQNEIDSDGIQNLSFGRQQFIKSSQNQRFGQIQNPSFQKKNTEKFANIQDILQMSNLETNHRFDQTIQMEAFFKKEMYEQEYGKNFINQPRDIYKIYDYYQIKDANLDDSSKNLQKSSLSCYNNINFSNLSYEKVNFE